MLSHEAPVLHEPVGELKYEGTASECAVLPFMFDRLSVNMPSLCKVSSAWVLLTAMLTVARQQDHLFLSGVMLE